MGYCWTFCGRINTTMSRPRRVPATGLLLLLLCIFSRLCAHEMPMLNLTTKDGLPSNTIYEIYRDSKGYLWVATDKGVARYNGLRFEVFTTYDGLADNEVFFFQEDKKGRLWFASFNGEMCYYKNDTFHNPANTPLLKLPSRSSFVQNIIPMPDSSVMLSFQGKNKFVHVQHHKCQEIDLGYSELANTFLNVTPLADSGLEFVFTDWLIDLSKQGKITKKPRGQTKIISRLFGQNATYFYNDTSIFTSTGHPVGRFSPHFLTTNRLLRIYAAENNLLLATDKSLIINDSIEILKGNKISTITQDIRGNYWVGSTNSGIYVLKHNFLRTRQFTGVYDGAALYSVKRGKHIFFATSSDVYDLADGKVRCIPGYPMHNKKENASTRDAVFYIDTSYRFLNFNNYELVVCEHIDAPQPKFVQNIGPSYGPKAIVPFNTELYIRGITSIYKVVTDSQQNGHVKAETIARSKNLERIFCLAKAPDNHIWYSTIENMYRLENDQSITLPQFSNYEFKYFNFFGDCLLGRTNHNQLVLGRNLLAKATFDTITAQNCIWDQFYRLDARHVLISTNNYYRLLTFNTTDTAAKYDLSVIEDPFIPSQAESILADSANCYFFKDGSITSFDFESIYSQPLPPELFFRHLKTNGNTYIIDSALSIPYNEANAISISFATLSFSAKKITFQYSISGQNELSWIDIVGDINLANIDYGQYVIKVRAKSYSSEYTRPIKFKLTILRPFWAEWWFAALISLSLVIAVAAVIRYRIKILLRQKEKKHKTEVRFMKSEYRALNALMNPHFIFNTLNNVQDLINKNDRLAANEYLRIFADLVRQNMHNISKELITLQKELDLVKNYLLLEKLRFEDKLNYSIDVAPNVDLSEIMIPPLLLQPIVENSIKHGILHLTTSDGFIAIRVFEKGNTIYLEVKDNGVGMGHKPANSFSHESLGMDNIKGRLKQLSVIQNKQYSLAISEERDQSGTLQWTVITISLSEG